MRIKNSFWLLAVLFTVNTFSQIRLKGIEVSNHEKDKSSILMSKPVALEKGSFLGNVTGLKKLQILFSAKEKEGKQYFSPIGLFNTYTSDDWLFFDEVVYIVGTKEQIKNGNAFEFRVKDKNVTRNVTETGIKETSLVFATKGSKANLFINHILINDNLELYVKYINNKDRKYDEVKVPKGTKNLKKRFKALLDAYNILCEKTGLKKEF